MSRAWGVNDWFVVLHINGVLVASTVFVFKHPEHFGIYAALVGTIVGFYHFMTISDDKRADA